MYTNKQELLNTQMSVEQPTNSNSSNDKLIERDIIPGTPFWKIKQNDEYTIVMGRYKINHIALTNEIDIDKFLKDEMYNVIATMVLSLIHNELEDALKLKINTNQI